MGTGVPITGGISVFGFRFKPSTNRAQRAGCPERESVKKEEKSSSSSFNYAELLTRVDNDRELLHDLVTVFKQEFPRHLQALREAVESRDGKRVAVAAHTLKGMLSNLAAGEASATAARLEQLGRNGETSELGEVFASLEKDAENLLPQLDACIEVQK